MNDSFEELAAQNIFSEEIPSEMEVAPCYKLLVHCLQPVTIQTALHSLNSSMYA